MLPVEHHAAAECRWALVDHSAPANGKLSIYCVPSPACVAGMRFCNYEADRKGRMLDGANVACDLVRFDAIKYV